VSELLFTLFLAGAVLFASSLLFLADEPVPLVAGAAMMVVALAGAALRPSRGREAHEATVDTRPAARRWEKWVWLFAILVVIALFLILAIGIPIVP
jgi:uncharacterized membrane protein